MTQTARIYGDSLYDLAVSEKLTETILEQAQAVKKIFQENPSWRRLLSETSLPKAERTGLIDQVLGGQTELYLLNFIKILCENNLLYEFEGCLSQYQARYYEDSGIAVAVVTSALALNDAQRAALIRRLEEKSGKKILLKEKVSASVIGGLRVELNGTLIDGTVAGRMAGLSRSIKV